MDSVAANPEKLKAEANAVATFARRRYSKAAFIDAFRQNLAAVGG